MPSEQQKPIEPYRVLFPIGAVFAMIGVSVWVSYALSARETYPSAIHSQLMIGTFLFAFAAGFLMTAIPKMTASFPAHPNELAIACFLTLTNGLLSASGASGLFYFSSALSIFMLLIFFFRRFKARTKEIPPFFPFVLCGLLSGVLGASLMSFTVGSEGSFSFQFGHKLYFEGMILLLVLGIGSRLVPVISGREIQDRPGLTSIILNLVVALSIVASLALAAGGYKMSGGLVKTAAALWIAYYNWGLLRKINSRSRLAFGMKTSGLMVIGGIVMALIQPAFAVHWMHLTYVAGFGLMTLTVASRVTLAHGSYDLKFEAQSSAFWICGALVLTAAATRVAAPYRLWLCNASSVRRSDLDSCCCSLVRCLREKNVWQGRAWKA